MVALEDEVRPRAKPLKEAKFAGACICAWVEPCRGSRTMDYLLESPSHLLESCFNTRLSSPRVNLLLDHPNCHVYFAHEVWIEVRAAEYS